VKPAQIGQVYQLLRIGLIVGFLILLVWLTGYVLLEIFAGLLLAVMVNGLTVRLARLVRLSYGWAFLCVMVVIVAGSSATIYFAAPRVVGQSYQIFNEASLALEQLFQKLSHALPSLQLSSEQLPNLRELTSSFVNLGTMMTSSLITLIIVLFVGFYAALNPPWYIDGFIRLFPQGHRPRIREVLGEIGHSLQLWLLGRAIMMVSVALLTLICLSLLSIPLAFTLSLIAGLLTFVPYFGALVSAVPAVLIAFVQSPVYAAYVVLIYLGAHAIEGYILAPLVQQRTVHLPPALMLSAQALMGTLFGITGAALAAPILVVMMTLTRILYQRDILHDEETDLRRCSVSRE